MKKILLTFDVEEFDFPREIDQEIEDEEMFAISFQGLREVLSLLERYRIPATFFCTTYFAKYYPDIIKEITLNHEIASHGLSHQAPLSVQSLTHAKQELEIITKKRANGFRAPRWGIKDFSIVEKAGFIYDSSTHPIFLPGRYNNLSQRRYIHRIHNLIEIPLSTLPPNFSLFWLAFKNFPLSYAKMFTRINFLRSDYTMLVFHPWEFTDLSQIPIPTYTKRKSGKELLKMLEKYIIFCKSKEYTFKTIGEFLKDKRYLNTI